MSKTKKFTLGCIIFAITILVTLLFNDNITEIDTKDSLTLMEAVTMLSEELDFKVTKSSKDTIENYDSLVNNYDMSNLNEDIIIFDYSYSEIINDIDKYGHNIIFIPLLSISAKSEVDSPGSELTIFQCKDKDANYFYIISNKIYPDINTGDNIYGYIIPISKQRFADKQDGESVIAACYILGKG